MCSNVDKSRYAGAMHNDVRYGGPERGVYVYLPCQLSRRLIMGV